MKHKLALAMLLLAVGASFVAAGCVYGIQSSPYQNATMGKQLYDVNNVTSWKYLVTMSASGANATWNMTVNDTRGAGAERHMTVGTVGNGMDILYDIWWNATTFQIERMHARGWLGDEYRDKDVSPLQIYTLPDVGLAYYFVPFQYMENVSVRSVDGIVSRAFIFKATDNKGFSVSYLHHPQVPLPLKIEMADQNFSYTMLLADYK